MLFDIVLLGATILIGGASAQDEPCATVSAMSASFLEAYPEATQAFVTAEAAEACLSSVPLDKDADKKLIEELLLYLSWQSNVAYLSSPPAGYTEERSNILDKIQRLYNKLDGDGYSDEYHFQQDLSLALTEAYDFHLYFTPDILTIFQFRRGNLLDVSENFALVSVSADGKELPKLYSWFDIQNAQGWTPSPITEINNKTADDYINDWAKTFTYHDKDARYNRLFPNQAGISKGEEVNQFVLSMIPDGPSTLVAHENGTKFEYPNYARILADFDGVDSGDNFFAKFCNQDPPTPQKKKREEPTLVKRALPTATGYPQPVYLHSESIIGGYYLDGNGYDDVAVLGIPSFSPESENGTAEFQDIAHAFLGAAAKAGKKRLVVDLRTNGGGSVFLGYDLFKQLFPKEEPYGATRFRANDAFNIAGEAMTSKLKGYTYDQAVQDFQANGYDSALALAWKSIFNYQLPVNVDGKNFTSWDDYFGPHVLNNDNFTTLQRYDLNNFFSDDLNMDVSGYRTRANLLSSQPFPSDKIVILQDGACGSTCAIFSEFMKAQAQVQQIVVGGTPKTGPMQGVAGSKGAQVYSFTRIYNEALNAYNFLSDYWDQLNGTQLEALVMAERPRRRTAYQDSGDASSAINLRDNIRKGDESNTPLEFVYEAADCKIFYTADMINDVTVTWKTTVDAYWGNKSACVEGSMGDKSSLSGGAIPKSQSGDKGAAVRGMSGGNGLVFVALFMSGLFLML